LLIKNFEYKRTVSIRLNLPLLARMVQIKEKRVFPPLLPLAVARASLVSSSISADSDTSGPEG